MDVLMGLNLRSRRDFRNGSGEGATEDEQEDIMEKVGESGNEVGESTVGDEGGKEEEGEGGECSG